VRHSAGALPQRRSTSTYACWQAVLQRLLEPKQYTSAAHAALAEQSGIRLSVGRTGQCWDNALAESFFSTLKGEMPGDRPWPSRAAARTAIFEFIESWYNLHRLHSSLGYRSPADFEAAAA
ncbi:integrase core domain-containing protein, partial [Streptosporangium sp. NPDC006013]|uniref:integrase core domain-containing protein n=1 Tax=Streptosporangium sp. NPDC006013 TaxID=3155596 RepID=UPI0033A422BA